jgi:uncharacterized membrane protein
VSTTRLEAFSDGVFAIAITLLVIELRPPEVAGSELADALWDLWPSYFAYLVSFGIIGVMWLNHHRIFRQVRQADGPLLLLNLHLLLWVALIPFPTAVVADYLAEGGAGARTAMVFYSLVFLLAGVAFGLLFGWITHDKRLVDRLPPREVVRAARFRFTLGPVVYVGTIVLSLLAPVAALVLHGAVAVYYLFDQATVPAGD